MNKIKYFAILVIAILALGSCSDFLDTEPKGTILPSTVKDLQSLLQDNARFINSGINTMYGADELTLADETFSALLTNDVMKPAYSWQNDNLYDPAVPDNDYLNYFKKIYTANLVLESIDDAPLTGGDDESTRTEVKAQALAVRAEAYLSLVNTYGEHFNAATDNNGLCVPLVLSSDIFQEYSRATVDEVYNQINQDLDNAEDLMTATTSEWEFYFNLTSLYGVRARAALYQQDYESAAFYAQNTLDEKSDLWNYETEGGLANMKNWKGANNNTNKELILNRSNGWYYAYRTYWASVVSPELVTILEENPDDLRLVNFVNYPVWYLNPLYAFFTNSGITVPEMYLTLAEAKARLNDVPAAMDALNTLRVKRIRAAGYVDETATDAADALTKVLKERRRELLFTGLRWFDQKRLNLDPSTQITVNRTVDGVALSPLVPGDSRYVIGITQGLKDLNPNF